MTTLTQSTETTAIGDRARARRGVPTNTLALVFAGAIAVIWLIPLLFTVLMSVRPQAEPINIGNIFFGSSITLANYEAAWIIAPWGQYLLNSLIFVVGVLIVQFMTVTMAATPLPGCVSPVVTFS